MSEKTYTGILDDGENRETVELESIEGQPVRSFVRPATVDGVQVDVVWELDGGSDREFVYRPAQGLGYGSG